MVGWLGEFSGSINPVWTNQHSGKRLWNFCAMDKARPWGHGIRGSRGGPRHRPDNSFISCLFTPRSKPVENHVYNKKAFFKCYIQYNMKKNTINSPSFVAKERSSCTLNCSWKLDKTCELSKLMQNIKIKVVNNNGVMDCTCIFLAWTRSPFSNADIRSLARHPK